MKHHLSWPLLYKWAESCTASYGELLSDLVPRSCFTVAKANLVQYMLVNVIEHAIIIQTHMSSCARRIHDLDQCVRYEGEFKYNTASWQCSAH